MEVTEASAGEIVVDNEGRDSEPLSFSRGHAEDLKLLQDVWASEEQEAVPNQVTAAQVVDLGGVARPAAQAACGRGFRALAWIPLTAQRKQVGVMKLLAADGTHLASGGSDRLLDVIGNQIAVGIQANQLFQDVLHRAREAQALYEIGLKITSLQDIQQILRSVVEEARETLGAETAALCLAREGGAGLTLADCSGPAEAFQRRPVQVPPFPVTLASAPARARNAGDGSQCIAISEEYRTHHLSAPLLVGTSTIGELCVSSRASKRFTDRHSHLLASLADMAAIAINNARLLEGERYLAVLEERERLAREMHDSLAQVLGYLHLQAQGVQSTLTEGNLGKAREELEEMATTAHEAYLDVREAILGLRETVSPRKGLLGTLREYLQKFSRQAGIEATVEAEGEEMPQFSPETEVQLIRAIQEALTNVRKHARADGAWVRISRRNGEFIISVEDNGQGFDPALLQRQDGRRFGVRTMRERIERVGGRFEIESSPGCGTNVRMYFSLEGGEEQS
jgi:nitrate/nitrite-specific signal transduction histidine kinase